MHNALDTYTPWGPMCYALESWESVKGESSSLGLQTHDFFFFSFSPPTCFFFLFPFPMKLISVSIYNNLLFCSIFMYYMHHVIKTLACKDPAFISQLGQQMLSRFFLNNWDKKMLAPHAVDIAVTISSLIASLCFTFAEPFDDIFLFVKSSCALESGNTNKSLRPKEWGIDRSTKRVNSRLCDNSFWVA